jgi:hypothetical protein
MDKAQKIVAAIEEDLMSRNGLQNEWEMIDEEIRAEIRETWIKLVREELARKEPVLDV